MKALYYPRLAAACLSWNSRTAGFDFNINIFIFFIFILPFLHFHSFLSTLSSSSGSQFKVFWSDSLIEIPQLSLGPLLPLKHPHAVHSHGFSANPRFQGLSHTCQCPKVAGTHVAGAGLGFSLFSAFSDVTSHAKRHNARRYPDWATSPPTCRFSSCSFAEAFPTCCSCCCTFLAIVRLISHFTATHTLVVAKTHVLSYFQLRESRFSTRK